MTLQGRMAFSIKSEHAVTLTVRRPEPRLDGAGAPVLALRLPWDVERIAGVPA